MLQPLGRVALAFLPLFLAACSSKGDDDASMSKAAEGYCRDKTPRLIAAAFSDSVNPVDALTETPADGSNCKAIEWSSPTGTHNHVPPSTPVASDTTPPSSGDHFPLFPQFRVYDYAIPRGF